MMKQLISSISDSNLPVISDYLRFIFREASNSSVSKGLDVLPHFLHKSILWSLFFCMLFYFIPTFYSTFYPKWYKELDERKRREFPSYAACLVHHLAMVPRAWVHVVTDFLRTPAVLAVIDYAPIEATIAPFCVGYLVSDTLCYAVPEMIYRGRYEFIVHHIMTLYLILSTLFAPGHFTRFIPHLVICDTSNIFLNISWLISIGIFGADMRQSFVVTILELLFAFSFLLVRVINLPTAFLAINLKEDVVELGWSRFTMAPIALLQWYWFSIIVSTTLKRINSRNQARSKSKAHNQKENDIMLREDISMKIANKNK